MEAADVTLATGDLGASDLARQTIESIHNAKHPSKSLLRIYLQCLWSAACRGSALSDLRLAIEPHDRRCGNEF